MKEIGIVKWFNDNRGYGFITTSVGDEVFVHYSNIGVKDDTYRSLVVGEKVEFVFIPSKSGNVHPVQAGEVSRVSC